MLYCVKYRPIAATKDLFRAECERLVLHCVVVSRPKPISNPENLRSADAPRYLKVLNTRTRSYASDVYSFGMVLWEILTMDVPWAGEIYPQDIMTRVLNGERPVIPEDAPQDMAAIVRSCWVNESEERPKASDLMARMRLPTRSDYS